MRYLAALVASIVILGTASAAAALQQPNGSPIPSQMGCDGGNPTGLAPTFACICDTPGVCNIGAACPGNQDPNSCDNGQNATCETTVWHSWNDDSCVPSNVSGLDPWTDGATTPETFMPTCGLTFTVVTRGTAIFKDVFGWYNVTGQKPSADDLHVMLDCNAGAGASATLDVLNHPDYAGGEIGFFIATPESSGGSTCEGGDCCATIDRVRNGVGHVYYSEKQFNPDAAGSDSYIHLVVFDSRITQRKFYFAWEDIYGGSNNDFTDFVTSVEGVECSGGGAPCDTGQPGVCSQGLLTCHTGSLECKPITGSSGEQCDGLDNDCDTQVDEDATCPNGEVCSGGRCLPNCDISNEFDCPTFSECDATTGQCVDPGCVGVSCPEGQTCMGGTCSDACDGVQCPEGQDCRAGECVDLCANVACPSGQVCRQGICFDGCNSCGGIVCTSQQTCQPSGACVGPGADVDAGVGGGDGGNPAGSDAGIGNPPGNAGCCNGRPESGGFALMLLTAMALMLRRRRA
jgi:hypothetical protein